MAEFGKLVRIFNIRFLAVVIGAAVLVGLGMWGYKTYMVGYEQKAQAAFADCIYAYEQAHVGQEPWSRIEGLSKTGYENHSRSSLAPYFLAIQAEALQYQNKSNEARETFKTLMGIISHSSPVYTIYRIKYALMCLDAQDKDVQQLGLTNLETIAYDQAVPNRDEALYYLGLYCSLHNQIDKARKAWTTLVEMLNDGSMAGSAWATLAQEKLRYL